MWHYVLHQNKTKSGRPVLKVCRELDQVSWNPCNSHAIVGTTQYTSRAADSNQINNKANCEPCHQPSNLSPVFDDVNIMSHVTDIICLHLHNDISRSCVFVDLTSCLRYNTSIRLRNIALQTSRSTGVRHTDILLYQKACTCLQDSLLRMIRNRTGRSLPRTHQHQCLCSNREAERKISRLSPQKIIRCWKGVNSSGTDDARVTNL